MSKKSATAQLFKINKSPLLVRFLLIAHSLAALASLANALPWLYKFVILAVVGLSLFLQLRRHQFQFQPYQIRHSEASGWQIAMTADDFQALKILPSTVVTVWLIVLHGRLKQGKRYDLVILKDALNNQDYRALVVTLKIAGLNQADN